MNTAATRAAIKRASQQARNAMQVLDRDTLDALQALYEDTANEVRAAIRAKVDSADMVPVQGLRDLLRQIEDAVTRLGMQRDALLAQGLSDAAELGVRPYTMQGISGVGAGVYPGSGAETRGAQASLTSAAAMTINHEAVQFVENFTAADGLKLSDRLWRLDQGAKEVLTRAIGQAVVSGWDASKAAAQFMYSGQSVPLDVQARLMGGKAGALVRQADLLVGDKGEVWKADRVFRTEINRAHGTAYMAGAAKTPGFVGFRFLLSPRHPAPDVCFRKGTMVTTRLGPVPIEKIQIGDEVLTHLGRWRPVVKLFESSSGLSRLVRLCFQEGNSRIREVVMTPNHPVLTPSGWMAAGDLRTGSTVVCLESAAVLPHQPRGAGVGRTASPDSGETASASGAQKIDQARCGARVQTDHCTARTGAVGSRQPTGSPMFDAAKSLPSGFLPSRPGCSCPCAGPTATAGTDPSAGTCSDDACHSSGCQRPSSAHTRCSNISESSHSALRQTTLRMSGRLAAWLRGFCCSTRLCSTRSPAPVLSTVALGMSFGILGRLPQPAYPAPSTVPNMRDCKTAWWSFAGRAPTGLGWVSAACRSVRRFFVESCADHIALTPHHAIVEVLPATGEPVYNIEVEDDHTYVANGLVVHNCDLLASQNLYGLGPGVYPSAGACPWPAHPNTLSFVEMVFADEVSAADRAGKETVPTAMARLSPAQREGVLGVEKSALNDAGLVKPYMIRSPLYAVKQRLARTGKA